MIKQESLDALFAAVDIVEVAHKLVPGLKKAGSSWKSKSPFVDEKSPSFFVVPSKELFKCFASGKGGKVVDLVMEIQKCEWIDAIKWLADKFNIVLEHDKKEESEEKKSLRKDGDVLLRTCLSKWKEIPKNIGDILEERGINQSDIHQWQLAYAPNENRFLTSRIIEAGLWDVAEKLGICKTGTNGNYDVYRDRIIFPIHDANNQLVGFAGRVTKAEKKTAKYINPYESLFYKKDNILYGLNYARTQIIKENKAYLVEGYTDVIAMHRMGFTNTVASCGTSVTDGQIRLLRRFTDTVCLVMDGDEAGVRSIIKHIDLFLAAGFNVQVSILPEKQDPDSLARDLDPDSDAHVEQYTKAIAGDIVDGVLYKSNELVKDAKDPHQMAGAAEQMHKMLLAINNPIKRNGYIQEICKQHKFKKLDFESAIRQMDKIESVDKQVSEHAVGLPAGVNRSDYEKDGFYIEDGKYWFLKIQNSAEAKHFAGTNFICQPLFHVYSKDDNKRLMRITNHLESKMLEVPSAALVSFTDFQRTIINEGHFIFMAGATQHHFKLLVSKLGAMFPICQELITLGYRTEGFYAFADGIVIDGVFQKVDEYGITRITIDQKNGKGEMKEVEKRFYSPAFSSIFKDVNEDDDQYENDRSFVFKQSTINLNQWMQLMVKAYPGKGELGIAYTLAALFRDVFFSRWGFFPHLFCYGEKGSGKSKFAESIHSIFFTGLGAFNLNSGTEVGFFSRIARVRNAVNWFDEYTDAIEEGRFQALKSSFDGVGREKGKKTGKNRTEITKVNSGCIITGQYLSSRDDNSLTTRSIVSEFVTGERPQAMIDAFDELKLIEEGGMSSIILEVLKIRKQVKGKLNEIFLSLKRDIKEDLKGKQVEERVIGNYCVLLSTIVAIQETKTFNFPFTFAQLYDLCKDQIIEKSALIASSDGMAEFWQIVNDLIDARVLQEDVNYTITAPDGINLKTTSGNKRWNNDHKVELVCVQFSRVHGEYMKEFKQRNARIGINKATLEGYLKSRNYYIGLTPATTFGTRKTSAYVFDADKLAEAGYDLRRSRTTSPVPNGPSIPEQTRIPVDSAWGGKN